MSKTHWTKDQLAAIETEGCNLLVAAAAGSGKTAVLVERIIRKVTKAEDPIDIDKLLVVTFTNAAASEMRERIGEAITRELDKNPNSPRLQKQLTLLPKASITTIHSFCLDVIRNNFHIINIDPHFRICDETEAVLLKQEAIEELFDLMYEAEDNDMFKALVESYGGGRSDQRLEEIVQSIHSFSESAPWPEKWLKDAAEDFNIDEACGFRFEESKWAVYIIKNIKLELAGLISSMQRAFDVINSNEELSVYRENFSEELGMLKEIIKHTDISWNSLSELLDSMSFGKLKPCRNADENLKKYVTDIRSDVKKSIKKIQGSMAGLSEEVITTEMTKLYPVMKELSKLVIDYKKIYADKKKDRGVIDFNDIEHYSLSILTGVDDASEVKPSVVAEAYREKFDEVLVDEYQDSNLVQEVILSMVSRSGEEIPNLFMVGDVKQSIYRFRQAMPELFLRKYNKYSENEGRERKITLFKNFRSRKEVVDGVNYIFKQIMSENIGELNYTEREELNLGADYPEIEEDVSPGRSVELHLIDNSKSADDNEEEVSGEDLETEEAGGTAVDIGGEVEEDVDSIQLEARMIARRIHDIIDLEYKEFMVYDKTAKAYRKAEFKDIVILLRTTKNWANAFLEEFSKEGIPAFADTGTGYFDTIEIKTMLAFLQVIDNPMQDIPLLSVLRSPIFSFTPEELIDIRLENEKSSFYEAMKAASERGIDALSIKTKDFLQRMDGWQRKSIYTPVDEFLWILYMETGYFSYVSAMPGGVQRQANLKVLFERAREYEATSYKGLFNFINFINKLKRNSGDMGSAKILGENENVVRIMSIHKSKGLEFPVVFVSGMGKGFNMMDLRAGILFHKELGYGPDFVDYKRRFLYSSTMKEAIKTRIRLETLSEEMRVLYVAFTRAKEKLIITGLVKNLEGSAKRWGSSSERIDGKLSEYNVLSARNYLDWICPAVLNHEGGMELLEISGAKGKIDLDTFSDFEVKLWNRKMILDKAVRDKNDEELDDIEIKPEIDYSPFSEEIERRLGFNYPYDRAYGLPAKLSVSELKRIKNLEIFDEVAASIFSSTVLKRPAFLEERTGLNSAEKGTIMHLTMQHLDFKTIKSREDIKRQIDRMIIKEIMTETEAKTIDVGKIEKFISSPLGRRMLSSGNIVRELPFTVDISVTQVYKDLPPERYKDEKLMLQGVIDCFFEENGEFVLIDYKTDYVENGDISPIKERYMLQINCYARALERITGKRVKEKYIYLFYNGEIIEY